MTPADRLKAEEARRRFAELVARPDAAIDLAHAALLVAAEERPATDVEHYRGRLLEMGLRARERVAAAGGRPVAALNSFFFEELGFAGNESDYYDPCNSLLPSVIDTRRGIPITLAVVYMELGRRAGITVEGVGLPGHFLVRARAETSETRLVDLFNRRLVDRDDCQQLLDGLFSGQVPLSEEHLRAATPREIVARILRNLKAVYAQAGRHRRALAAAERVLLVEPAAHDERRDRGLFLAQMGRHAEAVRETEAYLRLAPDAPDAEQVREQLRKMRARLASLN
jgi:regulator of sirC expression with transglutaminase-like and TPR domain